jgi:hypothetical protein
MGSKYVKYISSIRIMHNNTDYWQQSIMKQLDKYIPISTESQNECLVCKYVQYKYTVQAV